MMEMPSFFKIEDKREDGGNKSVKTLKVSQKKIHEDPKIVLKSRNYLNFLNNIKSGVIAGVQSETEFFKMKTSHKEKASSYNLEIPYSYDSCEVNFINGNDSSVLGMWCLRNKKEQTYVIGKIPYCIDGEDRTHSYMLSKKIVDMWPGTAEIITAFDYSPQHPPSLIEIYNIAISNYNKYCPPPWYSCSFIPSSDTALLGGDGYIVGIRSKKVYNRRVPGKACTLSLNGLSECLLSGLHTGVFWMFDRRTDRDSYSIKISDEAINDSLYLNDQEVIVTDVEGKLVKVDLRVRKTSAIFFGHKHSVTKRPFSVANNMLCATGVDNVVRIWHISGGHPIHVQKFTSQHEVRGWMNSKGNKTYLNYFEGDRRITFTI